MKRKRYRQAKQSEPGARPGMVAVRAAMAYGKEIKGVYVAENKLFMGEVVDGKIIVFPKTRFYNLRILFKVWIHKMKVFLN